MVEGALRVLLTAGGIVALLAGVAFAVFASMWLCLLAVRCIPLTGQWRKRASVAAEAILPTWRAEDAGPWLRCPGAADARDPAPPGRPSR